MRNRNWTITNHDMKWLPDTAIKNAKGVKYAVFGKEIGKETEKEHWQGYVEFNEGISLKTVKERLNIPTAHLESRKGTAQQASDYCKKDGQFIEIGKLSQQGKRNDLNDIFNSIKEGKSLKDVANENPSQWAYHRKAMADFKQLNEEVRNWETEVILLWGKSGSGKTREAIEAGATMLEIIGDFINGYDGEDIVVFDDIEPWTFKRYQFLKLFDRYPYKINIKGGTRNWKPKKVYLTTNNKPDEILTDKAMRRRVTEIRNICTEVVTQK